MTIHDCYGEYPPLTADLFKTTPGVDAPSPVQSAGGPSSIAEALEALDSLCAENAALRNQLAMAQQARDTAQAQLSTYRTYYTRTGW
jgi:hypothetical protein